jgi:hypothetical protein
LLEGRQIVNYIRHPSTINALREVMPNNIYPNNGIYSYQEGDLLIVVTLRNPQRGGQEQNVTLSELDLWLVEVLQS